MAVRTGLMGRVGVPACCFLYGWQSLQTVAGMGWEISDNQYAPWRRALGGILSSLLEARTTPLSLHSVAGIVESFSGYFKQEKLIWFCW